MALSELSDVLWTERRLLELLLFKLEEEQLVLTSGRTRWLAHATREVETVLDEIRDAELGRSVEADAVAIELGLEPGSTVQTYDPTGHTTAGADRSAQLLDRSF